MRYTVLHHTGWADDHYDLLLDLDGASALLTWRLDAFPSPTRITLSAPHRRMYLDYEGPVSNNRGAVLRVATGEWALVRESADQMHVRLEPNAIELTLPKR